MIEQVDTTIRLVAIGASSLLLVLLIVSEIRTALRLPLVGLLIGAAAYLVNSSPAFRPTDQVNPFIDLFSLSTPFWTWLFARTLFERDPTKGLLAAVAFALFGSWFAGFLVREINHISFYAIHLVSLALVADIIRVAWSEREDDLVEKRRMIRLWLPMLIGAQAGGILLYETIVGTAIPHPPVQLVNAILIFALTLFSGIVLLQTDPELLVETEADKPAQPKTETLSPVENVLREKLDAAMQDGFYRTSEMSIAALADHLDTPEHRLRALINQRLGYRNFSAFLNEFRIAEAREALADRSKVDLPVLTIAMDLGYNSLATFNRAFRADTGMAPTDSRKSAITGG